MYDNPDLILDPAELPTEPAAVTWRSPSNLAIIKYWGKHGEQLPRNPSLSLTLAASVTDMQLAYTAREEAAQEVGLEFYFHDEPNEAFQAKLQQFLTRLLPVFPFLNQFDLEIQSGNSFPHSAGIASSASAMSALALCLCSMEDALFGTLQDPAEFERKASYVARLGSGSACRSIYAYAAVWGATPLVPGSSDDYAVPAEQLLHPVFKTLQNDILIVSTAEKAVSSRAGHALMENNAFADPRYAQARQRFEQLLGALGAGDLETFGRIAEDEAMTLHALMMASDPSYVLLQPNTLALIERVRDYRQSTGHPIFFSLDAGPNLHVLYPEEYVHEIRVFVDEQLRPLCENGYVQNDWVGEGPEEL
jgi:diphosphomevalonate decarboxylase